MLKKLKHGFFTNHFIFDDRGSFKLDLEKGVILNEYKVSCR